MSQPNHSPHKKQWRVRFRLLAAVVLCLGTFPALAIPAYAAAPTYTSISVSSGPITGGNLVTFVGSGFIGTTNVQFGGQFSPRFIVGSDTLLAVVVPAGTAAISTSVVINTSGGSVMASNAYTYTASAPHVYNVNPKVGTSPGLNTITITGTGFINGQTTVTVGGVATGAVGAVHAIGAADIMTATVPPTTTVGQTDVVVTTVGGGTSSVVATDQYTYTATQPIVTSVSPATGLTTGGQAVTITGTGFLGSTDSTVYFGALAATVTGQAVLNAGLTVVTATSPLTNGTGAVPIRVKGAIETAISPTLGTSAVISTTPNYTFTAGVPSISSVSPNFGTIAGHQVVTVTGTNFLRTGAGGPTNIYFGGVQALTVSAPAIDTSDTFTVMTATTPWTATAPLVDVTATTSGGTSPITSLDQYQYTLVSPTITSIFPITGPNTGNTLVTITGTDFVNGSTSVYFNGNPAHTVGPVTSNGTVTVMTVTSSAGSVVGAPIDITATTPASSTTTSAADHFTFFAGVPTISSFTPATGPSAGGTTLTLTGTGFATGATTFTIGSVTSPFVGNVSVSNLISIVTATVPATINLGGALVKVSTVGGNGTATIPFTYTGIAPVVSGVAPNSGTTAGGNTVTITASGMINGQTGVIFGDGVGLQNAVPALAVGSVTLSGGTTVITAIVPPAFQGLTTTVDTIVTNTTGSSTANGTTDLYTPTLVAPTVTGISPATGSINGGNTITITGTGFVNGYTFMFFGGTSSITVGAVTVNGTTTVMTAVVPAYVNGSGVPVDVQAYTGAGLSATNGSDVYTYTGVPAAHRLQSSLQQSPAQKEQALAAMISQVPLGTPPQLSGILTPQQARTFVPVKTSRHLTAKVSTKAHAKAKVHATSHKAAHRVIKHKIVKHKVVHHAILKPKHKK